jgi:hypothetical protein
MGKSVCAYSSDSPLMIMWIRRLYETPAFWGATYTSSRSNLPPKNCTAISVLLHGGGHGLVTVQNDLKSFYLLFYRKKGQKSPTSHYFWLLLDVTSRGRVYSPNVISKLFVHWSIWKSAGESKLQRYIEVRYIGVSLYIKFYPPPSDTQ